MKRLFSVLLLTAALLSAYAQDQLYTTDGGKQEVKILEIGPNEIRYKKKSNPDGPDYIIPKSDVLVITFANGTHESFYQVWEHQTAGNPKGEGADSFEEKKFDSLTIKFGKNFISYNTIDMVNTNITFSYERFTANGKLGIRIPLSIGFGSTNNFYYEPSSNVGQGMIFAAGLDLNIYPAGQGKIRYYIAPSFVLSSFRYYWYLNYWDDQLGSWMVVNEHRMGFQYAALVKHGVLFQLSENFNMSVALGLGIRQNATMYEDNTAPKATFEFNVGYRF